VITIATQVECGPLRRAGPLGLPVNRGDADRVPHRVHRPIPSSALPPETRRHACLVERTGPVRACQRRRPSRTAGRDRARRLQCPHARAAAAALGGRAQRTLAMAAIDSPSTSRARSFPATRVSSVKTSRPCRSSRPQLAPRFALSATPRAPVDARDWPFEKPCVLSVPTRATPYCSRQRG
jgi:hypothetical protein